MSKTYTLTAECGGKQVKLTTKALAMVGVGAALYQQPINHSEGVCPAMRADIPHGCRVYLPLLGKMPIPGGTQRINHFQTEGWAG
jgi:hypothetical protein